jgi:hypothetical protein
MVKINLFFLLIAGFSFSQHNTTRIKEIDAMLIEIEELESIKETPCDISSYIEKVRDTTIIEDDGEYVVRQRATKCQYSSSDFSTLLLFEFPPDEPYYGPCICFYFKDNKLFYVASGFGDGGYSDYTYIYYNSLEKPILFIRKETGEDSNNQSYSENSIITDQDEQKEILSEVQGSLDQILRILNQ